MPELNTKVAYPFTKSDRARDKIMSEVMISRLHLSLVNGNDNIVLSYDGSNRIDEVLIHGYYFKLSDSLKDKYMTGIPDFLYIFVGKDAIITDDEDDTVFPELYQAIGSEQFAEHECLFDGSIFVSGDPDNDFTSDFKSATGLEKVGSVITDSDGNEVDMFGGSTTYAFIDISGIYRPYYFSETYDNHQKNKIWVRLYYDADNDAYQILNAYVYADGYVSADPAFDKWVPLGAVYKSDIESNS